MLVVMAPDGITLAGRGRSNGATGGARGEAGRPVVAGASTEHHVVLTYVRGPQVRLLALQTLTCGEVPAQAS